MLKLIPAKIILNASHWLTVSPLFYGIFPGKDIIYTIVACVYKEWVGFIGVVFNGGGGVCTYLVV